ncbi:MAG: hypothetical protein M0D57_17765 [Sphingobacteriales bacterium JAD_PAG50586_3]|nr:MAG: hypothetical protein M0D57_17765 [Sphingobacteriales bacterium JAD_PAG50586_3]
MIKPLYIICLFALLGLGLVSCKKEKSDSIEIMDISEYNSSEYIVNNSTFCFSAGTFSDFDYLSVDNNSVSDVKVGYQYSFQGGNAYSSYYIAKVNPGVLIEFAINSDSLLMPYLDGDNIGPSCIWYSKSYFSIPSEDLNIWFTGVKYIGFKIPDGNTYKYGFIKFYYDQTISKGCFGPSVMQR